MTKTKNKLKSGFLFVWNHPVILVPILLILAYLLFNEVRTQAFKPYLNCNYLLGDWLKMNTLGEMPLSSKTWTNGFCQGIHLGKVNVGLALFLDPALEIVRTVAVWVVLLFFAFISLLLTLIINNVKKIVRIVTFNREEWKRFGASIVTFLLIFVVFCTLFYFNVMHPNFLK